MGKIYWTPLKYESKEAPQIDDIKNFMENIKSKTYEHGVGIAGNYTHDFQFGTRDRKYDLDKTYKIIILVGGEKENVENFCREVIEELGIPEKPKLLMGEGDDLGSNMKGRKLLRELLKKI